MLVILRAQAASLGGMPGVAGKRAGPAALPPLGTTEPSVPLLELYAPGTG